MTRTWGFDPEQWDDDFFDVELRFEREPTDDEVAEIGRRWAAFDGCREHSAWSFSGSFALTSIYPPERVREALTAFRDLIGELTPSVIEAIVCNAVTSAPLWKLDPGPAHGSSQRPVDPSLAPLASRSAFARGIAARAAKKANAALNAMLAAAAKQPVGLVEVPLREPRPVPDEIMQRADGASRRFNDADVYQLNYYWPDHKPKHPEGLDAHSFPTFAPRGGRALLHAYQEPSRWLDEDRAMAVAEVSSGGAIREVWRVPDEDLCVYGLAWIDDATAAVTTKKRLVVIDVASGDERASVKGRFRQMLVVRGGRVVACDNDNDGVSLFAWKGGALAPLAKFPALELYGIEDDELRFTAFDQGFAPTRLDEAVAAVVPPGAGTDEVEAARAGETDRARAGDDEGDDEGEVKTEEARAGEGEGEAEAEGEGEVEAEGKAEDKALGARREGLKSWRLRSMERSMVRSLCVLPFAVAAAAAACTAAPDDPPPGTVDGLMVDVPAIRANWPPVAAPDQVATDEDYPLYMPAGALLGNDRDPEGFALTITAVGGAAGGSVAFDGDQVVFTPTHDWSGDAGFDYTVTDGDLSTQAHVDVVVGAIDDAPVPADDTAETREDLAAVMTTAQVLANDHDVEGDTLWITKVGGALGGAVSIAGDQIAFDPMADYHGPASFTYTVTDGAATATGTVYVTIDPVTECGDGEVSPFAATSLTLTWLATSCDQVDDITFHVGGVEVLRTPAAEVSCTCHPGVHQVTISDPTVMALVDGTVDFEALVDGTTLLAWARADIKDPAAGVRTVVIFDENGGGDAENLASDLCAAGSLEDGAGWTQATFGEACDDGNAISGDGCSATCARE